MSNWNAHVYLKWNHKATFNKDWAWFKDWKEVKAAWSTMGDWDMTLWVDLKTPEELEKFVQGKLRELDWIENTHSCWVKTVWNR